MNLFDFFKRENETKTKQPARQSVAVKDWTNDLAVNLALTKGLYHNSYPGLKLAGGLAYAPIAVPVWFMGLPVPVIEKDHVMEPWVDHIMRRFSTDMKQIHVQSHRDGTIWIWPKWSTKANEVVWEFIQDDTITDIIRDLDTGEVVQIFTKENIMIATAEGKRESIERHRDFTKSRVIITYRGAIPAGLKDVTRKNPLGILPIPFANNTDSEDVRGSSDYERILPDLKNYHDIDLAWSTMLAKFSVKMVQEGTADIKTWLDNNGYGSIADIDIAKTDFIYNIKDKESTKFEFPDRAHEAYREKLKNIFQKIVEESGVPEIAWGLKTEGNRASVEESMDVLIKYVEDKRMQKNEPYQTLFYATLQLYAQVNFIKDVPQVEVKWNKMDSVSDEVRSIIFRNFAQGAATLVQNAAVTKQRLFELWKNLYPETEDSEFEEFKKGLSDMGGHVQWTRLDYTESMDLQDLNSDEA